MRRTLIILLLLVAVSITGIGAAFIEVNSQRDQVVITPQYTDGDESSLNGLTTHLKMHYDDHLFWNTSYIAGETPSASTEYLFSAKELRQDMPQTYGINIYSDFIISHYTDAVTEQTPLGEVFRELYNSAQPGEEKTAIVDLSEYYEFYPLSVSIDLQRYWLYWNEEDILYDDRDPSEYEPGSDMYNIYHFTQFFRIPVVEGTTVEISVIKSSGDNSAYTSGISGITAGFQLYAEGFAANSALYFTFNNKTSEGENIDTSNIPGGYGIYALPYTDKEMPSGTRSNINIDELAMVYPLDEDVHFLNLKPSYDESKLLLFTIENDMYVMTVIDIATMETLQRIELTPTAGEYDSAVVYTDKADFVTVFMYDSRIAVISIDDSGVYSLEYVVASDIPDYPYYYGSMDFDGERLALGGFLNWGFTTLTFYLAVYDESGLQFYGEYGSSLSNYEGGNYDYHCLPVDYDPIDIVWNK